MIDASILTGVTAALVFCGGLLLGSKRPLRRQQQQLAIVNRKLADVNADLDAVTPLKVRAHQLHLMQVRLMHLTTRHAELDTQIDRLTTAIGFAEFQLEHRTLNNHEHAKVTRQLTADRSKRNLLCSQRTTILAELPQLTTSVNEESAAVEDARATAMVDHGLGRIEEIHATVVA